MAECKSRAARASLVRDARQFAVSTPQAPQDERDLGAIDEIFDVPHARLASTPKLGWLSRMQALCRDFTFRLLGFS
jgi:hypothetical protein